jgi:hypothetical protein
MVLASARRQLMSTTSAGRASLVELGRALADAKVRGQLLDECAGGEGGGGGADRGVSRASFPLSLDGAYEVQNAMTSVLLDAGYRLSGWKVGATSQAARNRIGLSTPFIGPVFESDVRPPHVGVDVSSFLCRGVEVEWGFRVRGGAWGA